MIFHHTWLPIKDGDPRAFALFRRHYSSRKQGSLRHPFDRRFIGPGQKLVLLSPESTDLFAWRYGIESHQTQPRGVCCTIFRRERTDNWKASAMIEQACELAQARWPNINLYTYVDPKMVQSTNPGYCFKVAGFTHIETTGTGILRLIRRAG